MSSLYTSITVAEAVRDCVATDAALLAWSRATYTATPTVYLGVDEDQPAEAGAYPVIGLVNLRRTGSLAANAIVWELDLGCAVLDDRVLTTAATAGQAATRTYPGLQQANYLTELVEAALLQSHLFISVTFSGESGAIADYPVFVSYSTLSLGLRASSRHPRFRS